MRMVFGMCVRAPGLVRVAGRRLAGSCAEVGRWREAGRGEAVGCGRAASCGEAGRQRAGARMPEVARGAPGLHRASCCGTPRTSRATTSLPTALSARIPVRLSSHPAHDTPAAHHQPAASSSHPAQALVVRTILAVRSA